ncbi:lysophospholipid acyltransferase family protein [Rickettsiaceae bacterium]|nr:lysophospholipid acyltransferase family protein [Rickettsiaceae bacterium]
MLKRYLKKLLKNNIVIHKIFVRLITLYLKIVYKTSKWCFVFQDEITEEIINRKRGALFAMWHNRLAFGMGLYKRYDNVHALASSHTDGKLITDVIKKMGYKVIVGSSNKNSTVALRQIIRTINSNGKVVITPDGPRGPMYKVGGNITQIGYKYKKSVIPVSCISSKYFTLKSWDKMMIPKIFGTIVVTIGRSVILSGDKEKDDELLKKTLSNLSDGSELVLKRIRPR